MSNLIRYSYIRISERKEKTFCLILLFQFMPYVSEKKRCLMASFFFFSFQLVWPVLGNLLDTYCKSEEEQCRRAAWLDAEGTLPGTNTDDTRWGRTLSPMLCSSARCGTRRGGADFVQNKFGWGRFSNTMCRLQKSHILSLYKHFHI